MSPDERMELDIIFSAEDEARRITIRRSDMRKLITIDRLWSDAIGVDEDGTPGWICWLRVFPDGENDGLPSDETIFNLKKDAMAWAKRNHPDARISYVTDCTRKRGIL